MEENKEEYPWRVRGYSPSENRGKEISPEEAQAYQDPFPPIMNEEDVPKTIRKSSRQIKKERVEARNSIPAKPNANDYGTPSEYYRAVNAYQKAILDRDRQERRMGYVSPTFASPTRPTGYTFITGTGESLYDSDYNNDVTGYYQPPAKYNVDDLTNDLAELSKQKTDKKVDKSREDGSIIYISNDLSYSRMVLTRKDGKFEAFKTLEYSYQKSPKDSRSTKYLLVLDLNGNFVEIVPSKEFNKRYDAIHNSHYSCAFSTFFTPSKYPDLFEHVKDKLNGHVEFTTEAYGPVGSSVSVSNYSWKVKQEIKDMIYRYDKYPVEKYPEGTVIEYRGTEGLGLGKMVEYEVEHSPNLCKISDSQGIEQIIEKNNILSICTR